MNEHNQHQMMNHNKTKALVLAAITLILVLTLVFGNKKGGKNFGFPIISSDSIHQTE